MTNHYAKRQDKTTGILLKACMAFFLTMTFWSCSDGTDPQPQPDPTPYLRVEANTVNFEETQQSRTLKVESNIDWICSSDASWLSATKGSGTLTLSVTDNDLKSVRSATVTVGGSSLSETITVQQLGWGKAILLSVSSVDIGAAGDIVDIEVTANVDVETEISTDWVSSVPDSRANDHPMVTRELTFSIKANTDDSSRSATITFRDSENGSEVQPATVFIRQGGLGNFEIGSLDDLKDDIEIRVVRGETSSAQPGEGIEKSFDGDLSTIYHSNWDNSSPDYFPITLTYYFEDDDMDYFVYYPRQSGYNGYFGQVDIEVLSDANSRATDEWQTVMTHDFGFNSSASKVAFPTPQIGVKAVRFTVHSGYGDGQGFVSCSEMKFYKNNPDNFDWATLFTDPSCTELKDNVTADDIENCNYAFFKNIAFYMFNDRYDKEFRCNTFRPYQHPNRQAASNKTSAYSLMDNPTGISVDAGQDLIVLADLKNEGMSLRVQNLDVPGGDGFGGTDYPISTGINKIHIEKSGLVYLMYHTDNFETAPAVKLHFVNGKTNGYYDSQDPRFSDRAKELLGNATNKYFDVVGKYAHLTFPTESYRTYSKDLRALIDAYDEFVYAEQQLLGLEKYGKMFNNRMYFNVMYTSYMYSTSYHTAYHEETLNEICNETALRTTACWGPAHEVGHSNQTTGLKWIGMTEVSNNIMSQYVQTTVFGQPSRLQTENMGDAANPNRYSKAWNGIIVPGIAHATHDDVFCKLVPLWQLQLYFGNVLGRTPLQQDDKGGFYPDVYEYLRTHANISDNGAEQLEFAYIASLCAEADLTDFFEKWGFFTPVDVTIDDYGQGRLNVTTQMADAIRNRIAQLGFSKPDIPLEYITDNNWEHIRSKLNVSVGAANRSGNTLTMNDWKNVIVYEVRENSPEGKLIHVSDGMLQKSSTASFKVPEWKDNYHVYAVQHDGKRIEVTF